MTKQRVSEKRDATAFPVTIFYDASCPVCASEIGALASRDGRCNLRMVDCSAPAFDAASLGRPGLSRSRMLEALHARDSNGRWFEGIDAFAIAYGCAGMTRVAGLLRHPLAKPLLSYLYPWVARHRFALSRTGLPAWFDRCVRRDGRPRGR